MTTLQWYYLTTEEAKERKHGSRTVYILGRYILGRSTSSLQDQAKKPVTDKIRFFLGCSKWAAQSG